MSVTKRQEHKEWEVVGEDKQVSYFMSLLELVSDQSLKRCMYKLVMAEDYEIAILYRNELVRRGKLKPEISAIPGPR